MHLLTMAEVQHLKDRGIPLRIDGVTRFVKGATKYTTCGDVIKMVLKKTGIRKEYRHLFVIYEVSSDIEKALPSKSRIMKVMDSWRGQPNRLVLRKSDPLTPLALTEKTKKWKLKTKAMREPAIRERRNPFSELFNNRRDKATDKQVEPESDDMMKVSDIPTTSSSDSDTSMDEFLSNLDHSKMAGLLNFFVAMTKKSQLHAKRRRESASSLESNASSNDSPVKKTANLRKYKRSRKTKRLNNKLKVDKASDVHPNKMHAVRRVNFGFIDVEPRTYDQWWSQTDVRITDGNTDNGRLRNGSHSSRLQSVRRRLIPSRVQTNDSNGNHVSGILCRANSCGPFDEETYTRPKNIRRSLPGKSRDILTDNYMHVIDSSHEEDSDSSTDLDTAFVRKFNYSCRVKDCEEIGTSLENFDETSDIDKPLLNSTRKLVNYSITDDELDNDDGAIDSSDFYDEEDNISNGNEKCLGLVNHGLEIGGMDSTIDEIRASISIKTRNYIVNRNNVCATSGSPRLNKDVTNYIKSIFKPQCENEDDEMNSFMKSMVLDDSSDDGVSSMSSEQDKEEVSV